MFQKGTKRAPKKLPGGIKIRRTAKRYGTRGLKIEECLSCVCDLDITRKRMTKKERFYCLIIILIDRLPPPLFSDS